ncbi:MAG: glycosyltransferase [Kiritimatiellia bacterium]
MRVWIENPFDNLPAEGFRPQRFWLMAEAFARAGHQVVYWTADFNHTTKRKRALSPVAAPPGIALVTVPAPPYRANVGLARIRSHRRYAANWARAARQAAAKGRPDVIILSTPPLATGEVAIRLARAWRAKLVVDIMDDWPGTFYRLLPRGWRWMGRLLFASAHRAARRLYAAADLVTGCADRYGDLVAPKPFARFYHGIEMEGDGADGGRIGPPQPDPSANRSDRLALLYLGNLGRTYDLATILRAVARLPDVTLDVAGAGAQEALLRNCRSARVRFHGYCGREEMAALLARADVGLVPMNPESCVGIPYKFADYARAGLAIVSSLGGESGALLTRYGAGEAYAGGDVASLVAALTRLRAHLAGAKAGARRLAAAEFDARRIYADYVAHVLR